MDKWIGIIKINREKETINFVSVNRDNASAVSFIPPQGVSAFQKKVDDQLSKLNLKSEKAIMQSEESILDKLDP